MRTHTLPLVAALILAALAASPSFALTEERSLSFLSPDGVRIEGIVVYPADQSSEEESGRAHPVAVLIHHHGRNRDSLLPLADALAKRGVASVLMDQRGHGASRILEETQSLYTFPILSESHIRRESFDQRDVVDLLRDDERIDLDRLAFVGIGIGAFVAAEASWRSVDETDALVLVDPAEPIAGFQPDRDLGLFGDRPVLIVCSSFARSQAVAQRLAGFGGGPREVRCTDDFEIADNLVREDMPALPIIADWVAATLEATE